VVKVMSAFRDLRGGQLIQIDGLTRGNVDEVIGEMLTLTVVRLPAAQRLVLARKEQRTAPPRGADSDHRHRSDERPECDRSCAAPPGRFDHIIEIGSREKAARLAILRVHSRGRPLAGDVNWRTWRASH
jgi:hypothetical protein